MILDNAAHRMHPVEEIAASFFTRRTACALLGAYAFVGGIVTLTGWFANVPRLTDWTGSGISMLPNTAVCAAGAGAALVLLTFLRKRWPTLLLGSVVGSIGAATLFQYFTGIDLGIDRLLLARDWGQYATVAPGRMGPPASASWTIIGLALVLASGGIKRRRAAVLCAVLAIAIGTLSIIGYLFGAQLLFTIP
ncbi:MAG TPA: hypothetical protein VK530_13360, partial [Candidatus Acidoferrum sp.]|nr:hypothetical protein [Candidatus Acidoferrum sp.]